MTTQTRPSTRTNNNQQNQLFLLVIVLIVSVAALVGIGQIWTEITSIRPVPRQEVAVTQTSGQIGPYQLDSYTFIANPYMGNNGCVAVETYTTIVNAQEHRCYNTLALPDVTTLVTTLGITPEQSASVLQRPDGLVFMPSNAAREGAEAAYFHVGAEVFYSVWVAGDCTPRIFNGQGGYWQMPVAPQFRTGENVPWGTGYLFTLPDNWQSEWRVSPAEAVAWRICAPSTFTQGVS